jgi:hypothetical protein
MALPRLAMAHGFGQRYDLPVPLWLWVTAAAATVACSFLVIGLFVRSTPGEAHGYPRVNLLQWGPGRLLTSVVRRSRATLNSSGFTSCPPSAL